MTYNILLIFVIISFGVSMFLWGYNLGMSYVLRMYEVCEEEEENDLQ